ncbi:replication initiator protein [Nocardia terpenica]|nr:replication initiator protein [Nocardia terpenica]
MRETAADRLSALDWLEIAQGAADKFGSCRKPIAMWVVDERTGERQPVGAACGNTLESVCPACAKRKRALRIAQCREGWHLDAEPVIVKPDPTDQQMDLVAARSSLQQDYQRAKEDGDTFTMDGIREIVRDLDAELRETGVRKRLPPLDAPPRKSSTRSTRRRTDVPELPRLKVTNRTVGEVFAGKYRPSTFVTLTMPGYGAVHRDGAKNRKGEVCGDGSPIDPDHYDYRQAARDVVHFAALFNRWVQNLRRAVGWKVQYFATVEPQRRGAPHIHLLIRGAVPNEIIRQCTAATYLQVWWPPHDMQAYWHGRLPRWDYDARTFVDPETGERLLSWGQGREIMDASDTPTHVARFGVQVKPKGILKGTPKADAAIGYLAKYLTKSVGEILEPPNQRTADHYDRLHAELLRTPCSDSCPVWLLYGVVPKGAGPKTVPGRCGANVHKRDCLGVAGNRQLVSKLWTGKTLKDHQAERQEFVKQLLDGAGIEQEDTSHLKVVLAEPGDPNVPPRHHLIMSLIAQQSRWRNQLMEARALLGESPPGDEPVKQLPEAA